ncbi:MAG: hypothetical protein ACREPR_05435 [Brasilonema sp.]
MNTTLIPQPHHLDRAIALATLKSKINKRSLWSFLNGISSKRLYPPL